MTREQAELQRKMLLEVAEDPERIWNVDTSEGQALTSLWGVGLVEVINFEPPYFEAGTFAACPSRSGEHVAELLEALS